MGTFNSNVIPASTGLKLGTSSQRWDAFIQNLDILNAPTFNAKNLNNIRFADQFGTISAAVSDIPAPGGIVFCPSGYRETITNTLTLGSSTKSIRLILGPDVIITFNIIDGISNGCVVSSGSGIIGTGASNFSNRTGGSVFSVAFTANMAKVISNSQTLAGERIFLDNFTVDNSGMGTTTALVDLADLFDRSVIRDLTVVQYGAAKGFYYHGSTVSSGESGGDLAIINLYSDSNSNAGAKPLVVDNTAIGSVQNLSFFGGAIVHPGTGNFCASIDGTTGGGIFGVSFYSTRFEGNLTDTTTSLVSITNASAISMHSPFFLRLSGGSTQYGVELNGTINSFSLINGYSLTGKMVKNNITSINRDEIYTSIYSYSGGVVSDRFAMSEATAPSGLTSYDLLYADSSAHRLKMNNNNGGALTVAATSGDTFTSSTLTSPVINGTPTGTGISTVTLKKGSGGGNYTSASTTYVVVDSTNLCNTVTIPTNWKLLVTASGDLGTSTAVVAASYAITDNAACSTANAGILVEGQVFGNAAGNTEPFSKSWIIAGDGASHNIALQFKTANGADSALLLNSSATLLPTMTFVLMPSN